MRKVLLLSLLVFMNLGVLAEEASVRLKTVKINLKDKASLQRGAQLYMNYCSGCHSLKYLRYSSLANGLGLTTFDGSIDKDLLKNNLIFTSASIMDPIHVAMPEEDARQWFGRMPPDLTLTGRERGADWIYTYLKSFYKDEKRPYGANNLLVPDVSMPNILSGLQGEVVAVKTGPNIDNPADMKLVLVEKGTMSQQQFDSILEDLVTFLVFVSEPHKLSRYSMGLWVVLFLGILAGFAYGLKKAYWRNIKKP